MTYPTKKLGEVALEIRSGFACAKKNEVEGGVVHMRTHNIDTGGNLNFDKTTQIPDELVDKNAFGLKKGDILFNNTNSTELVGKTALVKENLQRAFSNHLTRVRVDKKKALPEWVAYILMMLWQQKYFEHICTRWVGQSGVNQSALKKVEISLPPIGVQRKIVAKLESVLAKISEAKKLRAEARENADTLLSAELHKIFEEGKKKGWEEKSIGGPSIMKITSGGTPKKGHSEYYGGQIKWLKSGELEDNENIIDSEDYITEEGLKKSSAKLFPPQTVLLAMYGATAGKLGILGVEASTNQAVAGMICKPEKLHYKFLFYSLMHIRDEVIAKAWGGAQPNLSQTIIKKFKIVLPPISEQKEIVARLDTISQKVTAVKELQNQTAHEFSTLESSVLSKAFTGELV